MSTPVEIIKERLSIVDVISSYLAIEQAGKNYKARCPFHNEKTPSFFISPDRGTYYCFGCGEKGDIFSFVEKFEGTDFMGSLKLLAEKAGVVLEKRGSHEKKDDKELHYEVMEEATRFFEASFEKEPKARSYLRDRGLSDTTIQLFRVGYAPDVWRSASDHLLSKGYKKQDLETVGLIKTKDSGFYDRFRGRIMFPIADSSGRVIAFSGRIFDKPDSEEAKYLNSPDTPLFNKSNVLFGIDRAKAAIRSRGYSIVVEGQMDLLLSHQASFTNTVAVSGTAFADDVVDNKDRINNLGLIRRLSSNIIFAFDGDAAGIRACGRAALIALSLDMQVKVAVLPEGKDPADIIKENPDTWKTVIKNAVNIVSFHIDRICNGAQDGRIRGKQIREIVFPFLSMVKSAIERSAYMNEIHQKTNLSLEAIIEDFEMYEKGHSTLPRTSPPSDQHATDVRSRRDYLERRLFSIIFWQGKTKEQSDITEELRATFEKEISPPVFKRMLDTHEPFSDTLAYEAEMWYGGKTDALSRDMKELVLNLEEEILHESKRALQPLDTEEKLIEFNTIVKRIEEIKSKRRD